MSKFDELIQLEKENTPQGHAITVFFPKKFGLDPLNMRGPIPTNGSVLYIRSYGHKDSEHDYDYSLRSFGMKKLLQNWKVINVHYSVMVICGSRIENLRVILELRAEVTVVPNFYHVSL